MSIFNLPTTLTLIRLVLSPIVLPILFIYLLPLNNVWINLFLGFVFIGFSLTDFFDGYLARKYGQETPLGSVLDPIADKFLVFSALIALLVVHKIFFFWVLLLIGREFFMMGLRQVALEHQFSIQVSSFGKLKTTMQLICLTFIIINPYQHVGLGLHDKMLWNVIECILLLCATILSIYSAALYYHSFIKQFMAQQNSSINDQG